jgi:hypothetical protein
VFDRYPKTRPPLPAEYSAIYQQHYVENRGGGSPASALSQAMEAWMHRRVAADIKHSADRGATLEIGAGNLNHLTYEQATHPYDIVEPSAYLLRGAPGLPRIRDIYEDVRQIPSDHQYGRILSIATLEHLCDLPEVVARVGLLLAPGVEFRVAIPSEGTALWQWAQNLTTGIEFRLKYGLDYKILRRYEHVNTAGEVEDILSRFFDSLECHVFGISRRLSIYQFFVCGSPRLEICKSYLAERREAKVVTSSGRLIKTMAYRARQRCNID